MSRQAKERRQRRRELARGSMNPSVTDLAYVEELRSFVATEIPSLHSAAPWTPEQFHSIDEIYRKHLRDPRWFCPHDCGRVVARFGEQCAECVQRGQLGPLRVETVPRSKLRGGCMSWRHDRGNRTATTGSHLTQTRFEPPSPEPPRPILKEQ